MNQAWLCLILAAIAEALFGIGLFHSRGFTVFWPATLAVVAGIGTSILLGISMRTLPIGLSFVVWSGLASLATAGYGIICLNEPRDLTRLFLMGLIIAGVAGLKMTA